MLDLTLSLPGTPALPNSYFWTWDHSTNWVLDDPGTVNFGCFNRYLKRPETYVEDYRQLTDLAAALGIRGIVIWGFLRDSHGGIDAARRVADYAASRGVAILPGIGTNVYGGCYYEGDHKYSAASLVRSAADMAFIREDGSADPEAVCPSHPDFRDWLGEGVQWLFDEFAIGGANIENGDFVVCHCPRCNDHRQQWPADDPDFFRMQFLGYDPALRAIEGRLSDNLVAWATYTGFLPQVPQAGLHGLPHMRVERPALIDRLPSEGIIQWTLSGMVREQPLSLADYLDDGAPAAAFDNANWPADLMPPGKRQVGFLHHASQWSHIGRYDQAVSAIKEACLRAARCGLEGVSIHGEVTSRHIPWALNYLAFSHFTHRPEDTLRAFGRQTLGQVLESEDDGERFIEIMAAWDAGILSEGQRRTAAENAGRCRGQVAGGECLRPWRFWHWLDAMIVGRQERHTSSFF